jgi:hypothetical protein
MPLVFQYLCPDWCTVCSGRWNELRHGYIHVGWNISACSMIREVIEVSLRGMLSFISGIVADSCNISIIAYRSG